MYETPITVFETIPSIVEEVKKETDEHILKTIHKVGIDVNREELIKAMNYDRGQYDKGYKDGAKDFAEKLKADIKGEWEEQEENNMTDFINWCDWFTTDIEGVLKEMGCEDEQN